MTVTFDDLLRDHIASTGDTQPATVAARRLVDQVLAGDKGDTARDLLTGWLVDRAAAVVASEIRALTRQHRPPSSTPPRRDQRAAFATAARTGDIATLRDFTLVYRIDGVEKTLGEMTGDDHRWAAEAFQAIGQSSLMMAAIHRQVGRLLGRRRTQDALTETELGQLVEKIRPQIAAALPEPR